MCHFCSDSDDDRYADFKREISAVMQEIHRKGAGMPIPDGVTPTESHIIASIAMLQERCGAVRPSELTKAGHTTPSALSQTLRSLEGKGLITRERANEDFRSVVVRLTDRGAEVAAEAARLRSDYWSDLLDFLGEEDLEDFMRIMRRMLEFRKARG